MKRASVTAGIGALAILLSTVISSAQGTGGSPGAGSTGAGTAGVSGMPSGAGNSTRLSTPPAPGTNSAGTAQSSGSSLNTEPGMTTGSGPQSTDAAIAEENRTIDRKLKSICRGC